MEIENNVEQAVVTPAAIGGDKEETASYGKFKSSDELLNAYNALEAEFTRRSQRIKELEGKLESGRIAEEWTNRLNGQVSRIQKTYQGTGRIHQSQRNFDRR